MNTNKLKKFNTALAFVGSLVVYIILFGFILSIPEHLYLDTLIIFIVIIFCIKIKAKFKIYRPNISAIARGILWSSLLPLIYFTYVMIDLLINYPK